MSEPQEKVFGQGQTLFRQGEKGGDLYFVKSGKVELTVRDNNSGESAVVAVVGDKSVLGTMSFLEGDARSATAKCLTEVHAIVINEGQREKLLKTVPAWFAVLVKDLSVSLRRLNVEFAHLKAENDLLKKRVKKDAPEGKDPKEPAAESGEKSAAANDTKGPHVVKS